MVQNHSLLKDISSTNLKAFIEFPFEVKIYDSNGITILIQIIL